MGCDGDDFNAWWDDEIVMVMMCCVMGRQDEEVSVIDCFLKVA